jgi:uncharacterized membrane protein YkvA (DUF1232 family)
VSPALRFVIALGIAVGATWLALIVALLVMRPEGSALREALRILPDTIRLLRRLATDRALPVAVRVRLWLLFVYLAVPIDIVPDFIPVLGYADDVIIVMAVLRTVVRRTGLDAIRRLWPGTPDGLDTLARLAGLERV